MLRSDQYPSMQEAFYFFFFSKCQTHIYVLQSIKKRHGRSQFSVQVVLLCIDICKAKLDLSTKLSMVRYEYIRIGFLLDTLVLCNVMSERTQNILFSIYFHGRHLLATPQHLLTFLHLLLNLLIIRKFKNIYIYIYIIINKNYKIE